MADALAYCFKEVLFSGGQETKQSGKLHRLGELVSMMCVCVYVYVYTYFFHLHKKSCGLEEDSDGRQSHRGRARVISDGTVFPPTGF